MRSRSTGSRAGRCDPHERQRDPDKILAAWLDEGPTRAARRHAPGDPHRPSHDSTGPARPSRAMEVPADEHVRPWGGGACRRGSRDRRAGALRQPERWRWRAEPVLCLEPGILVLELDAEHTGIGSAASAARRHVRISLVRLSGRLPNRLDRHPWDGAMAARHGALPRRPDQRLDRQACRWRPGSALRRLDRPAQRDDDGPVPCLRQPPLQPVQQRPVLPGRPAAGAGDDRLPGEPRGEPPAGRGRGQHQWL